MVDILSMVDLTSISAMLAAIGVTVGVVFAILQLRNLVKQRRTELLMNIYSRITQDFANALERLRTRESMGYNDYAKKYGLADIYHLGSVYEALGYLIHTKLVDKDLVCQTLSESTIMTWEKIKPMVEDARTQLSQRKSGEYVPILTWWENLYNEVKKREQRLQQTQQ